MEIYLDESGDMGFNFESSHPSRHFVITLLVCADRGVVKSIQRAVRHTLKNKLNHKKKTIHQELKASKLSSEIKHYFFRQMIRQDGWSLFTIVLDKFALFSAYKQLPTKHRIYNHLSREALKLVDLNNVSSVKLIVDRSKNREEIKHFNQLIINHLESRLDLCIPLKILHEKSHSYPGLQAVDLFSWGIFRHYEINDAVWRNYILQNSKEIIMNRFDEEIGP